MIESAGEAVEFEGLRWRSRLRELGCELASNGAKSVILANSG